MENNHKFWRLVVIFFKGAGLIVSMIGLNREILAKKPLLRSSVKHGVRSFIVHDAVRLELTSFCENKLD